MLAIISYPKPRDRKYTTTFQETHYPPIPSCQIGNSQALGASYLPEIAGVIRTFAIHHTYEGMLANIAGKYAEFLRHWEPWMEWYKVYKTHTGQQLPNGHSQIK